MSGAEQSSGRGPILGAGAVILAALCCFAGPVILGAVAGAAIGCSLVEVAAIGGVALVAAAVALFLRSRQRKGASGCCARCS